MPHARPRPLPSLIEQILLVDEIMRPDPVAFSASSTPGHLLHVVESGQVEQRADGLYETFGKGDLVWYHEGESIKGRILSAPWRFITINFTAPALVPPREDRRVLRATEPTRQLARELLTLWRDTTLPPAVRALRCLLTLSQLLLDLLPLEASTASMEAGEIELYQVWWRAEKRLRAQLARPMSLAAIAELTGMSPRTAIRVCKEVTGMTPVQRLRELRLAYARNLLQSTQLQVTEIAYQAGYPRVQEFSRDFKQHHGCTPSEMRARQPCYQNISP